MGSNHVQHESLDKSLMLPVAPHAPAPSAGSWFLGKLLEGAGSVIGTLGFALSAFGGVIWMNQAGSGGAVNPHAPLFFLLGIMICGGGVMIGLAGQRLSKRK